MKKQYKYVSIILILIVALFVLNSCSLFMPPDQKFDGGDLLDEEKLSEIREEIFSYESETSANIEPETDNETKTDAASDDSSEAYQSAGVATDIETDSAGVATDIETDSGGVATDIETDSGGVAIEIETDLVTVEDITDTIEYESADSGEDSAEYTEPSEQTVYWTKGGEVWHTSQSCRYLKNKSFVYGTIEDAIAADKSRVCSACSK